MYYKYKVKKKNKHTFRHIIIVLILLATGFFSYRYREHLMFWKYSDNKLIVLLKAAEANEDKGIRATELKKLIPVFDEYRNTNDLTAEAFFFSARLHYAIGLTYLPGTFSELIINDHIKEISNSAKAEFEKAIKYMNKGMAFLEKQQVERDYLMILAYSCFYTGYLNPQELNNIIAPINAMELGDNIEDIRLYALLNILNKNEEAGFSLLSEKGMVETGIDGILFMAGLENMVGRSTNAIMNYKKVLSLTGDFRILKLVHVNLGKIYYSQSLFNESLEQFNAALEIDEGDISLKIWIGRNYLSLGQADRAKKTWADALATDKNNSELKKLLGVR